MAAGGLAQAPVAMGDQAIGDVGFSIHHSVPRQEFMEAVVRRLPQVPRAIIRLFYACLPR